jgi:hypothetical protein
VRHGPFAADITAFARMSLKLAKSWIVLKHIEGGRRAKLCHAGLPRSRPGLGPITRGVCLKARRFCDVIARRDLQAGR